MSKITISSLLKSLESEKYVIVKSKKKYDTYEVGEDIDIFCEDISTICKKIIIYLNSYISNQANLQITCISKYHYHLDFREENSIDLRFDIYAKLPSYKKLNIKPTLFYKMLNSRVKQDHVWVLNRRFEGVIRYLEFQEYYNQRPEKTKHLQYILNEYTEDEKKEILKTIHTFTSLPK